MDPVKVLRSKFGKAWRSKDERTRRLMAAEEAIAWGDGGISAVNAASEMSRTTIAKGIAEREAGAVPKPGRIRRSGGGRKSVTTADPDLLPALDRLISPDPGSPLRWVCESTRELATELRSQGHAVSSVKLAQLLQGQHFILQRHRKAGEVDDDSTRVAQFRRINTMVKRALAAGRPVLSVDTETRARPDSGADRRPPSRRQKQSVTVRRTLPCGLYDLRGNAEFVVDNNSDAGAFAVASIRGWWRAEGRRLYPQAKELLITADSGGGARDRPWILEWQELADATGLSVTACHFPRGARKWNKVEHRLFSFTSSNRRTESHRDYETTVSLIAPTTTKATGLTIICRLDPPKSPCELSETDIETVNLERDPFQGNWNYRILPNSTHR